MHSQQNKILIVVCESRGPHGVNVMVMMTCDMMLCGSINMYHCFWGTGLLHHVA